MQKSLLFQIMKKNFIQSNLIIKNGFQLFKIFIQMIEQFLHILLLKANVIFFWYINNKFFNIWRIYSSKNNWIINEINLN